MIVHQKETDMGRFQLKCLYMHTIPVLYRNEERPCRPMKKPTYSIVSYRENNENALIYSCYNAF